MDAFDHGWEDGTKDREPDPDQYENAEDREEYMEGFREAHRAWTRDL